MAVIKDHTLNELIEFSRLLGEFGQIKRVTLMPGGDYESDSHHSFSLALIAFELASQYAPELDTQKLLLYSLVHDLPELVTGDISTLKLSPEDLEKKAKADALAIAQTEKLLANAPNVLRAIQAYEAKADDESLFVYWIDKMMTIPTHFYDNGANLRRLGIQNQQDIREWYERTLAKLQKQKRQPHASAITIFELAYQKMHDELLSAR